MYRYAIAFFVVLAAFAAERARIRVDSELVLIPVSVTDPQNHSVTGLDRETFRVFEGKTERPVVQFSSGDAPVSVGIVFDASGSMADKISRSREAVAEFLKTANPEDDFFLVEFSDRARVSVPFTTDAGEIQNHLMNTPSQGKTPLWDAVYLAMNYMKGAQHSRRALLVISDGGDNESRYTAGEIRRVMRESDVWIYAIGVYSRTIILPEQEPAGRALLSRLAEETGGREYALNDPRDLPRTAAGIGLELRNQYVLGFTPDGAVRDGKYHRVEVRVVQPGRLHVSARPGYYAPAQ